jgi:hypothetical protein
MASGIVGTAAMKYQAAITVVLITVRDARQMDFA